MQPTLFDAEPTYHNTNHETGTTIAASHLNAHQQQAIVLAFFERNPGGTFAPHEVHAAVADSGTPLTSIRRAITNLTTCGRLEKTREMRAGTFGKQVHTWKLAVDSLVKATA